MNLDAEFRVEVVGRRRIADQVVELTLRTLDGEAPRWEPGAHIDLIFTRFLAAQYSLCGDPDNRDTLTVAVQREPRGRGASLYVHNMLTVGKRLRARGPRNDFPLRAAERYLFIAGGIGITPVLPMVRTRQLAVIAGHWRTAGAPARAWPTSRNSPHSAATSRYARRTRPVRWTSTRFCRPPNREPTCTAAARNRC